MHSSWWVWYFGTVLFVRWVQQELIKRSKTTNVISDRCVKIAVELKFCLVPKFWIHFPHKDQFSIPSIKEPKTGVHVLLPLLGITEVLVRKPPWMSLRKILGISAQNFSSKLSKRNLMDRSEWHAKPSASKQTCANLVGRRRIHTTFGNMLANANGWLGFIWTKRQ